MDHKDDPAHVISDDAQTDIGLLIRTVGYPGLLGDIVDDGPNGIRLEDALHSLKHGRHALQTHAGIDALASQRM